MSPGHDEYKGVEKVTFSKMSRHTHTQHSGCGGPNTIDRTRQDKTRQDKVQVHYYATYVLKQTCIDTQMYRETHRTGCGQGQSDVFLLYCNCCWYCEDIMMLPCMTWHQVRNATWSPGYRIYTSKEQVTPHSKPAEDSSPKVEIP